MSMHHFADQLAGALEHAGTLENLVRPLLELLQAVTGLESTYLATVDLDAGQQYVLYARNTKKLQVAEGLAVAWEDTLCRRALDEGCTYTDHADMRWPDSQAAAALGIASFASVPVHTADGRLYGTLCGASDKHRPQRPGALPVLQMFARLIAQQIDRERLMDSLRRANVALAVSARTDVVTQLPNRRALLDEMRRRMETTSGGGHALLAAFIDLDGFKQVNDAYGHDAGDRLLAAVGGRLQGVLRDGDFVARFGGDEFVVLSGAPREGAEAVAEAMAVRLAAATTGAFALGEVVLDYAGPSIGCAVSAPGDDAEALLARADSRMYQVKQGRKHHAGI